MTELSEGTKYYFQRKYTEAQMKLKLRFASVAAPDPSDFITSVIDETVISLKKDRNTWRFEKSYSNLWKK